MAYYRTIAMAFWTDTKVVDDFTPEDKYFYLYLLTNPHTNLAGCYELSLMQASNELGYTKDVVGRLINRFIQVHKIIDYDYNTKEILIVNWGKNNWTSSEKYRTTVSKQIENIKSLHFKEFLIELFNASDRVSIGYQYPTDTTNTITITNTNNSIKLKTKVNKVIYYPEDADLNKAFTDYVDMRKKIKAPMTDRAIELAKNKLYKLSDDNNEKAIAILEQSVMNSWKGLFELKNDTEKPKSNKFNNFSGRSYTNEQLERLIGG